MGRRSRPPSRRYEAYTGNQEWRVDHPDHGSVVVYAPTSQSAIVVAAKVLGQQWTKLDWYSRCTVVPLGTRAKTKVVS